MWNNLNLIINKNIFKYLISKLLSKDKIFRQPYSIANEINKYFCDVPADLVSKIPSQGKHFKSYMSCKASCFHLERVSEIEVLLLLGGLDKKKSLGLDKIHPILLATASIVIYQPLMHIINLSIKQGIFPRSLKIAKVIPVFKQCSRTCCHNY